MLFCGIDRCRGLCSRFMSFRRRLNVLRGGKFTFHFHVCPFRRAIHRNGVSQQGELTERADRSGVNEGEPSLSVVYRAISGLSPYERNARAHSKTQIAKIAESIRAFGFTNPVLIDRDQRIVAGHGRVSAAKLIGLDQVPTILLENLTPSQVQDNRLAEDAGWNPKILKIELRKSHHRRTARHLSHGL